MRLHGRHYATGEAIEIECARGTITSIRGTAAGASSASWIAPALFDLQINGGEGRSFHSARLTVEEVRHIAGVGRRHGIGQFCPTVITNSFEALVHALTIIRQACEADSELSAAMPAIHLEGPYISAEEGPRGAHPASHIRPPDWDEFRRLQDAAARVATLDVLSSFAQVAETESYVRPVVDEGFDLEIAGGRHPVVERMMARDRFIPNDVRLTPDARMIILTGPNMAGKSTVLRQVGLIVLMAQAGCFVPATRARIGLVDRVFTRVGASDNLVRGQSTFMVEMAETSAILHLASARSLVLLDEIGRGTSTYDGVSIAWAVSEHLHDRAGCKTIFATHYHELTQLADELAAVRNFNVAVREAGDDVVFLHRLQPGGADRSYGIEVGRLAGLPAPVIERARAVLRLLEGEQLVAGLAGKPRRDGDRAPFADPQLGLFAGAHPVLERLRSIDPDRMTPLDALAMLDELARLARERDRG